MNGTSLWQQKQTVCEGGMCSNYFLTTPQLAIRAIRAEMLEKDYDYWHWKCKEALEKKQVNIAKEVVSTFLNPGGMENTGLTCST